MVDIYGRFATRKCPGEVDLSEYVTQDLIRLTGIELDEAFVFQQKQGRLKTSNIKWADIILQDLDATKDNIVVFTSDGKILKNSNISIAEFRRYISISGGLMTGSLVMTGNRIAGLGESKLADDAATKKHVDAGNVTISIVLTITSDRLTALRSEYDVHATACTCHLGNYQGLLPVAYDLFGRPIPASSKLGELRTQLNDTVGVKTSIETIKRTLAAISAQVKGFDGKTNELETESNNIQNRVNNIDHELGRISAVALGFSWTLGNMRFDDTIKEINDKIICIDTRINDVGKDVIS